jgi:PleD family two-component response regulator
MHEKISLHPLGAVEMKIEISSDKLAAAQDAKTKAKEEKRAKILVVDDEEGNLVSLKNLLETHYEVFVEISPEAALEVFEAKRYRFDSIGSANARNARYRAP